MRLPVYPRGANPRLARPILHKKLTYCEKQVEDCLADWVDPADPGQGIVAREFLPSGKALPVTVNELTTAFVRQTRFCQPDRPTNYANELIAAVRIPPKAVSLPTWDWSAEPATA
jgi:hypothetical protein